jgi:hypothetical protein
MTIDACQSIAASSQLLCLISIRLIDLDLPVPGNHVSPPFPAYSSEVCSAGRDSNVDRYTMMVKGLGAGADGLTCPRNEPEGISGTRMFLLPLATRLRSSVDDPKTSPLINVGRGRSDIAGFG